MDEEIERLVVSVRADTQGFARDVSAMKAELDGPLAQGAERAGRMLETTLLRAVRTGKLGFEDLKRVALSVLADIANAALRNGLDAILGGAGQQRGQGGLFSLGNAVLGSALGLPGRATGGPVSPARPYWVGERGPELFVPTASGSIAVPQASRARDVRISIAVNAPAGAAPDMLARSSRQVARQVRAALLREE